MAANACRDLRPGPWLSLQEGLQAEVSYYNLDATAPGQALCELFRKIDGSVLSTGAAKGNHEVFKTTPLVRCDARVYERHHAREKLVDAVMLLEILDDCRVTTRQILVSLLASGIRKRAGIENKSAAVSAFIIRQPFVVRKTESAEHEILVFR